MEASTQDNSLDNCTLPPLELCSESARKQPEEMALTRPIPVTNARLEFSSLVFASNLSHTPPAVAVISNLPAPSFHQQQVQDQYWIIPVQETTYI